MWVLSKSENFEVWISDGLYWLDQLAVWTEMYKRQVMTLSYIVEMIIICFLESEAVSITISLSVVITVLICLRGGGDDLRARNLSWYYQLDIGVKIENNDRVAKKQCGMSFSGEVSRQWLKSWAEIYRVW